MVPFCCCAFGALSLEDPIVEHAACCGMPEPQKGSEAPDSNSSCGEACAGSDLTEWVSKDRPDSSVLLTAAVSLRFHTERRFPDTEKLTFRQGYWKPPPAAALRTLHCRWLI